MMDTADWLKFWQGKREKEEYSIRNPQLRHMWIQYARKQKFHRLNPPADRHKLVDRYIALLKKRLAAAKPHQKEGAFTWSAGHLHISVEPDDLELLFVSKMPQRLDPSEARELARWLMFFANRMDETQMNRDIYARRRAYLREKLREWRKQKSLATDAGP